MTEFNFKAAQKMKFSIKDFFSKYDQIRSFTKFTGKHLCQSLFFNKVADLRRPTLWKKRLLHKCFPVNFEKLGIWSHLLKKSLMENFIFCGVIFFKAKLPIVAFIFLNSRLEVPSLKQYQNQYGGPSIRWQQLGMGIWHLLLRKERYLVHFVRLARYLS